MVRLSAFMIMGFLTMTIAQLIEAVYLGIVGTAELAAIAFTFPLVMSLNAAVRGIGIGASSVIARVIGAGDRARGAVLTTHCLILVAAFAALCVAIGVPGARAFFVLFGAQGRVLELADDYIAVWLVGFMFFATSMVGTQPAALGRQCGDAGHRDDGRFAAAGADRTVSDLRLGRTARARHRRRGVVVRHRTAVSFALCMYWIAVKERMLVPRVEGWLHSARQILHVGLPATASNLVAPLSTGIVTRLLADFGHGVVAGFAVASRIEAVIAMVVIAVSTSVGPFVGQNWGAQLFDRVRSALALCHGFCLGWGVASFLVMAVAARWLVGMINGEPEVVETATMYLLIVPISLGFMGVMGVASACFNALGKPTPPLVLSLLRLVVLLIPLALIGRALAGYAGVFGATAIANVAVGILALAWNNRTVRTDADAIRNTAAAAA